MNDVAFRKLVLGYFRKHGRHYLPWRKAINPYRVLVSESMLQQTQVPRVIQKYKEFLRAFPTFRALASASTADVLRVWQGLGYNRRALALQRCAQGVVQNYKGRLPQVYEALIALPGIGPYTANAILAFSFDMPVTMIETNIRRVYLHYFFPTAKNVPDTKLFPLIQRDVLRVRSARQWYGALMDYGTHLAATLENPNKRSKSYVRQSVFEGSLRQLRGKVLRSVADAGEVSLEYLIATLHDARTGQVVATLEREGFLRVLQDVVSLAVA